MNSHTPEKNIDDRINAIYQSARDELIQRVALRDQSMFAYLVAAGSYFGFVVDGKLQISENDRSVIAQIGIVLVLPILSLVFTYITLQHHVMIGKISEFLRELIGKNPNHWDRFYAEWPDKSYLSARTISQGLLFFVPVIYSAVYFLNIGYLIYDDKLLLVIISLAILFDIYVLVMISRLQIWAIKVRRGTDYI